MTSIYEKLNWSTLEAIISGPVYAALLLLIPFGMLTALSVVMDPGFMVYEFLPEELLFIPWVILSVFISLGNIRISNIRGSIYGKNRIITITNIKAENYMKNNGEIFLDKIAKDIGSYIEESNEKNIKSLTTKIREYGSDIIVEDNENQILSIAVSSSAWSLTNKKSNSLIVEVLVSLEPPFFPWSRIKYNGNLDLKQKIEEIIENYLKKMQFSYSIET